MEFAVFSLTVTLMSIPPLFCIFLDKGYFAAALFVHSPHIVDFRLYLLKPNLTPPPLFLNNSNLQHAYFLLCIYIKRSKNYQPLYIELTFIVDQKNCKYVVSICKQNWKSEKNKTDRHFASDDAKMPNVPKNVCRWIWNKKM